ncbi:hypothetical protein [Streptomyces brevispora]|uniref:hypothetical protein n=1 Tax=Streptomyces brevispora TaxID=887462 RepID=UPI00380DE163
MGDGPKCVVPTTRREGSRGIGIVGAAAVIAELWHATGARPRTLPLARTGCCLTCPECEAPTGAGWHPLQG